MYNYKVFALLVAFACIFSGCDQGGEDESRSAEQAPPTETPVEPVSQVSTQPTTKPVPASNPAAAEQRPRESTGTLSGASWLSRRSGQSNVLRGLEVFLIPETVSPSQAQKYVIDPVASGFERRADSERKRAEEYRDHSIATIRNAAPSVAENAEEFDAKAAALRSWGKGLPERVNVTTLAAILKEYNNSITDLGRLFRFAIAETHTNVDGKYEFREVPPGDYVLAAEMGDSKSGAWWFVPVTIEGDESMSVDLFNENLFHVESGN